jgi:hypothetical protein
MNSALKLLTAFAISLISTSLIYKQFNLPEWEPSAFLGGSILFFVIAVILGKVFKIGLITSLVFSSIITGFIMSFISAIFGIFLLLFGLIGLILLFAYISEQSEW